MRLYSGLEPFLFGVFIFMKSQSIVLVDAYSQIFRSFYAIRMLTNSRNEPVNAAFVFTKLLLQLEKKHASAYGAMLFDCGKVDFRLAINPLYKANRPPMPEELKMQIPLIRRIAAAFGWQLLQHEGFEADDLIGGIAAKYRMFPVKIVSSDKDLTQLIDQRVNMLLPASGGGFELRGVAEAVKKFGVPPENMVDYLALLGDSADNIPGVPGIGPKSAVEILQTFGPADSWLDSPEKIDAGSRVGKKLLPELETVRRNRKLIRLRLELPEGLTDDVLPPVRGGVNWDEIREICLDNSFNSILKELPASGAAKPEKMVHICDEPDDLFSFANAGNEVRGNSAEKKKDEPQEIQDELF